MPRALRDLLRPRHQRRPGLHHAHERAIADWGFASPAPALAPRPAARPTGHRVAVVGSGPAGLACAQQLARAGHRVTVYERHEAPGGLLRYGIPDFRLEKHLIDARSGQMQAEGVVFVTGVAVGPDLPAAQLLAEHDAVCLATGATQPRELPIPGRELPGVRFAMDSLTPQNRRVAAHGPHAQPEPHDPLSAHGKHVVVIGGGDTGSDCVGTANRQGAASITQIEILPTPPGARTEDMPWPRWPLSLRTSSSHEEGANRRFAILTERFVASERGHLRALEATRIRWLPGPDGAPPGRFEPIEGSRFELPCDLALVALCFTGPEPNPLYAALGAAPNPRGHLDAPPPRPRDTPPPPPPPPGSRPYQTANPKVFACGDARRGQSLVVWAIWEGREAARAIDAHLQGQPHLPTRPAPMPV